MPFSIVSMAQRGEDVDTFGGRAARLGCEDMLDLIFEEVEREGMMGMPFSSLIDSILSLRGSNPAKVKALAPQKAIKSCDRTWWSW